jgi:hypothetical protein
MFLQRGGGGQQQQQQQQEQQQESASAVEANIVHDMILSVSKVMACIYTHLYKRAV